MNDRYNVSGDVEANMEARNMHIHKRTATSGNRRNRGQNRSLLSSIVNEMHHIRVDGVYSNLGVWVGVSR